LEELKALLEKHEAEISEMRIVDREARLEGYIRDNWFCVYAEATEFCSGVGEDHIQDMINNLENQN
jgi:uncharacterized protein CbrC (UPF0167 family)